MSKSQIEVEHRCTVEHISLPKWVVGVATRLFILMVALVIGIAIGGLVIVGGIVMSQVYAREKMDTIQDSIRHIHNEVQKLDK